MTTAPRKPTFTTKIDFDADTREQLIELCNRRLADTSDLYSQTKQAHWNVKGIHFQQLHEFFDKLADSVEPFADIIAERVTTLGGFARGTVRMAAANSSLDEYPDITDGHDHLEALRERYARYAADNRDAIRRAGELDDPTSEDLFTEISRTIDLDLYFIESHLQGRQTEH